MRRLLGSPACRRALVVLAGALLCAAGLAAGLAAAQQAPRGLLWEAHGPAGRVFLLGSIHLLRPEAAALPPALDAALDAADVVVFELDLEAARAGAGALLQQGMLPPGPSLAEQLGPDLYARLQAHLARVALPEAVAARFEPWLLGLTLTTLTLQQAGFADTLGLDAQVWRAAGARALERLGLETLADQIALFDGLPEAQQVDFLRRTLDEADHLVPQLDTLTAAWQQGDPAPLEAAAATMKQGTPALYERLNVARNRRWMAQLDALLAEGKTPLVVVGALHLAGPDGLVAQLRARGFTVVLTGR